MGEERPLGVNEGGWQIGDGVIVVSQRYWGSDIVKGGFVGNETLWRWDAVDVGEKISGRCD